MAARSYYDLEIVSQYRPAKKETRRPGWGVVIFLFLLVLLLGFLLALFLPVPGEEAQLLPRLAAEQDPTGPGIVGGAWIQVKQAGWLGLQRGPLARSDIIGVSFDLKNLRRKPQALDSSSLKLVVGLQDIPVSAATLRVAEDQEPVSIFGLTLPPQKTVRVDAYFELPQVTAPVKLGFRGFDWRTRDYALLNVPLREEPPSPRVNTPRR